MQVPEQNTRDRAFSASLLRPIRFLPIGALGTVLPGHTTVITHVTLAMGSHSEVSFLGPVLVPYLKMPVSARVCVQVIYLGGDPRTQVRRGGM